MIFSTLFLVSGSLSVSVLEQLVPDFCTGDDVDVVRVGLREGA